jgi:hypothetical protein
MKKFGAMFMAGLVLLTLVGLVAAGATGLDSAKTRICEILYNIRDLLTFIAAGIAAVVIVLQGVKWVGSAEDPGARKQAKQGIIHAVVGLVIVLVAVWIVVMVVASNDCKLS